MNKKNYYYLDTSVLLEEDFYLLLEELWRTVPDICFVIDANIYHDIENYLSLGKITEAQVLQSSVNLLAALGAALQVDTAGGFDATSLLPLSDENLYILTQEQRLVENYAELSGKATFLHLVDGKPTPFARGMSENGVAFCPERDAYVTALDGYKLD